MLDKIGLPSARGGRAEIAHNIPKVICVNSTELTSMSMSISEPAGDAL